jgi:hypothetical protein
MSDLENSDLETLAKEWSTRLEQYRMTHYLLADRLRWWNYVVGSLAVLASAVVSAGILTTIHSAPDFWWKVAGAAVGLFATSLTGLRTYLQFGEVSERHRVAAAKFGGIKRELDVLIDSHPTWSADTTEKAMKATGDQISQLEQTAPGYPQSWWKKGCLAAKSYDEMASSSRR